MSRFPTIVIKRFLIVATVLSVSAYGKPTDEISQTAVKTDSPEAEPWIRKLEEHLAGRNPEGIPNEQASLSLPWPAVYPSEVREQLSEPSLRSPAWPNTQEPSLQSNGNWLTKESLIDYIRRSQQRGKPDQDISILGTPGQVPYNSGTWSNPQGVLIQPQDSRYWITDSQRDDESRNNWVRSQERSNPVMYDRSATALRSSGTSTNVVEESSRERAAVANSNAAILADSDLRNNWVRSQELSNPVMYDRSATALRSPVTSTQVVEESSRERAAVANSNAAIQTDSDLRNNRVRSQARSNPVLYDRSGTAFGSGAYTSSNDVERSSEGIANEDEAVLTNIDILRNNWLRSQRHPAVYEHSEIPLGSSRSITNVNEEQDITKRGDLISTNTNLGNNRITPQQRQNDLLYDRSETSLGSSELKPWQRSQLRGDVSRDAIIIDQASNVPRSYQQSATNRGDENPGTLVQKQTIINGETRDVFDEFNVFDDKSEGGETKLLGEIPQYVADKDEVAESRYVATSLNSQNADTSYYTQNILNYQALSYPDLKRPDTLRSSRNVFQGSDGEVLGNKEELSSTNSLLSSTKVKESEIGEEKEIKITRNVDEPLIIKPLAEQLSSTYTEDENSSASVIENTYEELSNNNRLQRPTTVAKSYSANVEESEVAKFHKDEDIKVISDNDWLSTYPEAKTVTSTKVVEETSKVREISVDREEVISTNPLVDFTNYPVARNVEAEDVEVAQKKTEISADRKEVISTNPLVDSSNYPVARNVEAEDVEVAQKKTEISADREEVISTNPLVDSSNYPVARNVEAEDVEVAQKKTEISADREEVISTNPLVDSLNYPVARNVEAEDVEVAQKKTEISADREEVISTNPLVDSLNYPVARNVEAEDVEAAQKKTEIDQLTKETTKSDAVKNIKNVTDRLLPGELGEVAKDVIEKVTVCLEEIGLSGIIDNFRNVVNNANSGSVNKPWPPKSIQVGIEDIARNTKDTLETIKNKNAITSDIVNGINQVIDTDKVREGFKNVLHKVTDVIERSSVTNSQDTNDSDLRTNRINTWSPYFRRQNDLAAESSYSESTSKIRQSSNTDVAANAPFFIVQNGIERLVKSVSELIEQFSYLISQPLTDDLKENIENVINILGPDLIREEWENFRSIIGEILHSLFPLVTLQIQGSESLRNLPKTLLSFIKRIVSTSGRLFSGVRKIVKVVIGRMSCLAKSVLSFFSLRAEPRDTIQWKSLSNVELQRSDNPRFLFNPFRFNLFRFLNDLKNRRKLSTY